MPKGKNSIYLSADCRQLLHAADDVIDINIIEDPTYKVVN
jgi:SulP family sulfate permease